MQPDMSTEATPVVAERVVEESDIQRVSSRRFTKHLFLIQKLLLKF